MAKSMKRDAGFIPRDRLEALTDGVFAFAMTLLVVNIELPEDFHPQTNREFLSRIAERDSGRARVNDGWVELAILVASALLSIGVSLFAPDYAMLPYLLNIATPFAARAVYRQA